MHEFELDLQNTEAHQSRIEEQITQNQERGRTTPTKVARKDAVGETNWEEMYQQVVAEKQGSFFVRVCVWRGCRLMEVVDPVLQQVIDSFKAKIALHAREIESKQHLIEQLQEHIEENAFEFEAKCREVVTLQVEIAKLGEEVEATRELVTMGLRERERTREERERAIVDGTMDSEMEARLEAEARGSEVGQEYGDITDEEEEARRLSAVAEEEEEEGVEQGQEQEMSLRDLGPVRRRGSPGPENEQHEATTDDEDHTARLDAPTHTYTRPVSRLGNTRPLSPSEAPSEYPSQSRVNLHASSSSSFTPKTGGAIFGSPEDPEASYRPASRATRAPSRTSGAGGRRYLDVEDLGRVQADLEERRSNRSMASSSSGSEFGGGARRRERVLERSASTPSELREVLPSASLPLPSSHLHYQQQQQQQRSQPQQQQQQLQPPRTRFARHHSSPPDINGPGPSTAAPASSSEPPFPRIRGDQLERLFFGGAEHNTQTCRACKGGAGGTHQEPAWLVGRSAAPRSGMGSARVKVHAPSEEADDEEERVYRAGVGEGDRVPPQTVLARVVRQLEDDFAHYKS